MSKGTKALTRDPEGFVIPGKLRSTTPSPEPDPNLKENWPISSNHSSKQNFSKTQLQTRCRLFKTIRSALDNPKQSKTVTQPVFNQIRKGLSELPNHSSFIPSLKEIVRLIFEGGGIPSVFLQSVSDWLGPDSAEKCLESLILDLQNNNTSVLQYYPIKPRKPSESLFLELFTDFFMGACDSLCKGFVKDVQLESIGITCKWIKSISNVSIRPLRHSGCVALNGILRSLIATKSDLLDKLARFRAQLDSESPGTGARDKLEEESLRTNKIVERVDSIIKDIVADSWIARSQDVSQDIRNSCLSTLSESILQPHMANLVCESGIPSLLTGLLPEELNSNRIQILRSILICTETKEIIEKCSDSFTEQSFLKNLKNLAALASKLPSDSEISSCGELALRVLLKLLEHELLKEEFVDEIVDLLWLNPSSPEISSLLSEFVDSALFEGGISHENVEARELIELASHHIENKKIRSLMNLDGLKPLEPSRTRSDLQTLLEFIHEFGRDLVVLTHRCVNAFWTKAPCVRDSKFLVEMLLATECSPSSQMEPLNEEMRKALLLVLHANVSRIEELLLMESGEAPDLFSSKSESQLCRFRAIVAVSAILEYMEPLTLLHEQNTDYLTTLLSIFSTCISLYCKLVQDKRNSGLVQSGIKHFPIQKFMNLIHSHTDSRVIDGICMILSPIVSLDCKSSFLSDNSLIDIQNEIESLNKKLLDTFLVSGKEFLANTDGLLYSDVVENTSKSKKQKKSSKTSNAQTSTLNTMCNFRKAFGVVKYLTINNVYLSNQLRDHFSPYKPSEMSPEQGSGVPNSFEILFEVLERSERIIQLNIDQVLSYQCTQLYTITLDMLTTGYAHLVQDLLHELDVDTSHRNNLHPIRDQMSEFDDLALSSVKETTIEVYKAVRHKLGGVLLESLRNNIKHNSENGQCLNLINLLSLCSFLVMIGLQGTIESNLKYIDTEDQVKWTFSDSELVLITKEFIYWTSPDRGKIEDDKSKLPKLSLSLIEGFNNILNHSCQEKPYHLLYPSCRMFEPLDNLKDEAFVTTPETLDTYENKINDFLSHPFSPGCILVIIAISSKYKTTQEIFIPILINYLADIDDIMNNNYYLESIKPNTDSEINKEKLVFSNKFLEFILLKEDQNHFRIFTCILTCLIISYIQDNTERAQRLSKKLLPRLTSKIGWRRIEDLIKYSPLDFSKSVLECLRFALFGELSHPVFRDVISRDELIEKNVRTKGIIQLFLDFITTQIAPGGGKTVINTISSVEIQRILDRAKELCDFNGNNSSTGRLSAMINRELFDNDIMNFLDIISGQKDKKSLNKSRNPHIQTVDTDSESSPSRDNSAIISSDSNTSRPKRKRASKSLGSNFIDSEDEENVDLDNEIVDDSNLSDN